MKDACQVTSQVQPDADKTEKTPVTKKDPQ